MVYNLICDISTGSTNSDSGNNGPSTVSCIGHIIERFSMLFDKTPLHKASLMEEEGRTNFVRNGIFLTKPFQASSECSYLSIIYLESDVH